MSAPEQAVLFEAKDISKDFVVTIALDHVNLKINRGEIRGLIGENGSGKSTLASIVAGMIAPSSGEMYLNGQHHQPDTMLEGARAGIGMIVQEMGTISGISIAQNIFLGSENKFLRNGLIDARAMNQAAKKMLAEIGFADINPGASIDALDMQDRKLIEVTKVMYSNPEILIVDETTTALSQKGRSIIYEIMRKMQEAGKAVIFISHDLEETMEHCTSLTVLRDGKLIANVAKEDFDDKLIKTYMVGREIGNHYYREDNQCSYSENAVIDVQNLTTGRGLTENISFQLHEGEILGIGGLSHCGMHELGKAVFGEEKVVTGRVTHVASGREIISSHIAIEQSIGYVSKNRDQEALIINASVRDNIIGASFDKVKGPGSFILYRNEKKYVNKLVDSLRIKCSDINALVKSLSGGNRQKVVFAKWLGRKSKILILDCPTRGVDIGVKAAMYALMEQMKSDGASILMISEEMTELLGMCDRILVMRNGRISGELTRGDNFSEAAMIDMMI